MAGYTIPPHRKNPWLTFTLWNPLEEKREKGFVKKGSKKVTAHFKLSGFFFWRWWTLTDIEE